MIAIMKGDVNRLKGQWKDARRADDTRTALVSCPTCGEVASLDDYEISAKGEVRPSVVCPNLKCRFHDFVTLRGWSPKPKVA